MPTYAAISYLRSLLLLPGYLSTLVNSTYIQTYKQYIHTHVRVLNANTYSSPMYDESTFTTYMQRGLLLLVGRLAFFVVMIVVDNNVVVVIKYFRMLQACNICGEYTISEHYFASIILMMSLFPITLLFVDTKYVFFFVCFCIGGFLSSGNVISFHT